MKTTRLFTALFFIFAISFSQDEDKKSSNNFVFDGNLEFQKERFSDAEYNYRKATSFDSLNYKAPYNLGNSLSQVIGSVIMYKLRITPDASPNEDIKSATPS